MTTFEINPSTGQAIFRGFTPDSIGATPITAYNALASTISQNQTSISSLNSSVNSINTTIANLSPSNVRLGSISQNANNEVLLNANTFVDGQLTAYAKLETRIAVNGMNLQAWTESVKHSSRIDLWSEDSTKEYELSLFRGTYCTNAKSGFAIYKPNQTDSINHYLAANGESYLCGNNGFLGIGFTTNASERLQVNGNIRATGAFKLGSNINQISYASAAPTTGSYKRGDIIFNNAPSASGFVGWVCTTTGNPGTWKTWGVISA